VDVTKNISAVTSGLLAPLSQARKQLPNGLLDMAMQNTPTTERGRPPYRKSMVCNYISYPKLDRRGGM
jgi:hypothetical protein